MLLRPSPRGMGDPPDLFDDAMKIHHPPESLPLTAILRKLLYRRCVGLLRTRQGRQRALVGTVGIVFFTLVMMSATQLPDADEEAHQPHTQRRPASAMISITKAAAVATSGSPPPEAALPFPDEGTELSPPPPPSPSEAELEKDSSEYGVELRRRANELNLEIARYKEHESKASKAQRLRKTAEQLDSELRALKQVRQTSFSLKGTKHPTDGKQQQQQQQQPGTDSAHGQQAAEAALTAEMASSASAGGDRGVLRRDGDARLLSAATTGAVGGGARASAIDAMPNTRHVPPLPPPPLDSASPLIRQTSTRSRLLPGAAAAAARESASASLRTPAAATPADEAELVAGSRTAGGNDACRRAHPEFRIAILMPWVTEETATTRFPPWLPYFVATARHSAMLVDFLMVHEGALQPQELVTRIMAPLEEGAYTLHATRYTPRATRHALHATRYTPRATRHALPSLALCLALRSSVRL